MNASQQLETYRGFLRMTKWLSIGSVLTLALMALFLL